MTSVAILLLNNGSSGSGTPGSASIKTAALSGGGTGTANVVVWTSTPSQTSASSRSTATAVDLTYYQYFDDSHQFHHTHGLLQRLAVGDVTQSTVDGIASVGADAPRLAAIHVASVGRGKKAKPADAAAVTTASTAESMDPSTKRLLRVVSKSIATTASLTATNTHSEDDDEDENGNHRPTSPRNGAVSSILQHHDTYKVGASGGGIASKPSSAMTSADLNRLSSVMHQLLTPQNDETEEQPNEAEAATEHDSATLAATQAWLQLTGDVSWQQHAEIAHGLVFYLHTAGQWPVVVTVPGMSTVASIRKGHLDSVLSLDAIAANAIHLWPPATLGEQVVTGGTVHTNSIFGLLSAACQTAAGKRRLHQWLQQPLVDLHAIVARQDAVERLVQESVCRDAIRTLGLRQFASTDLTKLAATLASYAQQQRTEPVDGIASQDADSAKPQANQNSRRALAALYDLYLVSSQKVPLLTEQVEQLALSFDSASATTSTQGSLLYEILSTLQECQVQLLRSVELVEAVLDLERAPREFLIQTDYKEELQDIQNELDDVQVELDACHKQMNQWWAEASNSANHSDKAVRLEAAPESDAHSWQFRLPDTNDSKILQHQLADRVTVHRVLKNGVYFTTKALRALSTKQHELRAEYDRHQRSVALDAAAVGATYSAVLERASRAVSLLDVIAALAHTAAYSPHGYCRPTLTDSDEDGHGIELTAARHPCVELQDSIDYIPNDVKLVFGESSFLLVTGPNMGGKSTYIRALGAIVTMAQIGSFVPCASAKINICHHILARVGAGDLQERGISTFMAEMLESSSILRTATKRSLIIIDELGRGTSTFDGYGLARAISEYMVQKIGCMTVFATHFHELTVLEDQEAAVKNCHVTAQKGVQGLTFLYEIKPGPCLESFGVQVAEMADVPAVVVQDAKRRARELENFEYRKKARVNEGAGTEADATDSGTTTTESTAEEIAAAAAFVNRFRNLPREVLSKEYSSEAEKRAAVLRLIEA